MKIGVTRKLSTMVQADWEDAIEELCFGNYPETAMRGVRFGEMFANWVISEKVRDALVEGRNEVADQDFLYRGTECRRYYRAWGAAFADVVCGEYTKTHTSVLQLETVQKTTAAVTAVGMEAAFSADLYLSAVLAINSYLWSRAKNTASYNAQRNELAETYKKAQFVYGLKGE